ncbi:MAG: hypothetical protein ACI4T5_03295 [Prevotella sp.]
MYISIGGGGYVCGNPRSLMYRLPVEADEPRCNCHRGYTKDAFKRPVKHRLPSSVYDYEQMNVRTIRITK